MKAKTLSPLTLQDLINAYHLDDVDRAQTAAQTAKVRDHVPFMADWLTENAERVSAGAGRSPRKLRCDNCNRQTWLDDLVIRLGQAICTTACLRLPQDALEAAGGEWPLTKTARILKER